jgi:hypothetical protein
MILIYKLSQHAKKEMERRGIPLPMVDAVLEHPQQIITEYQEMKAYQSQIDFGEGKFYLLRAIVNDQVSSPMVITVYRTSKILKYWRAT